jgi:hypothetical protein
MMVSHKTNNRRHATHARRRSAIRRIIDALLRGRTDEDRAAAEIEAATKRGAK